MNQSNYSKIERNQQEPSMEQLRRICQILGISADFLLSLSYFNSLSENDMALLFDIKSAIKKHMDRLAEESEN